MKYFTGVGSRETPEDICELMSTTASYLGARDYVLRSGGADGADIAFAKGSYIAEIYLPWHGFNNLFADCYLVPVNWKNYKQAQQIASEIHPVWDKLTNGAKALHTRNVYQVLGQDLNNPSSLFICYAKPTKTGVSGGTNTAYQLALKYNVPIFNLYKDEDRQRIENKVYAYI